MGRIGTGSSSGPSQAIPFATLQAQFAGTQSANTFYAGPGSGGVAFPTWRLITGVDLPLPGASSLGGVQSLTCSSHNWFNTLSTSGAFGCSQPALSDLTGVATPAQGGTGNNNSTNSANDVLASSGTNGNFVHTALLTLINAVCTISPSGCNLLFGHYSVLWFGFSCTGASEASIIQTVYNALPSTGGVIYIPPGSNCNDSSFVTITTHNVTIMGATRATGNSAPPNVSRLNYTGTNARYIDARSVVGTAIINLELTYSSASFTGSLVDVSSNNIGVTVGGYVTIEGSFLGPNSARTGTSTLVNLGQTVDTTISRNFFYHGAPAILGGVTAGQNTVARILDNVFVLSDTVTISGCGESWTLDGNSFEPTSGGQAESFATISTLPCTGMVWKNNWFGDITANGGTFIDIWCRGCVFEGNRMAGYATASTNVGINLNTSKGVVIQGNAFDFLSIGINCATAVGGLLVTGNNFGGFAGGTVTTAVANTANCTPNYVNQAND